MFNCARRIFGGADADDSLAVASAFHDLGIWSDGTFDYLAPSAARAASWCQAERRDLDVDLVTRTIENHHRLRRYSGPPDAQVVEAFRRADLVDVSRGLVRSGLPRELLRELGGRFPYRGFHSILVGTALRWFVRHPLRPLPMLR